jgi:hypothetical protein
MYIMYIIFYDIIVADIIVAGTRFIATSPPRKPPLVITPTTVKNPGFEKKQLFFVKKQ